MRQVRNQSWPRPQENNGPVFQIQKGSTLAMKDFPQNVYVTTMKGALVLDNAFRKSNYTINVNIGEDAQFSTDVFCFLVDSQCPVNQLQKAKEEQANVRIFTHDVAPGWLEYILVATKPIKKVPATTFTHAYTERRQKRLMN
jgi:hypothetical protein